MRKVFVLFGLSFFLVALLATSFAGFPLEPIPGRTCWEWHLDEIESKDVVWSGLVWREFVESDGMTITDIGGDSVQVQLTIPSGLHYYSKSIPSNKLCPKGKASECGHYDCADVYLGNYGEPVLRVELDNFKDDRETDILLSGYGVDDKTNAGQIKLRNVTITYKHYLYSDTTGKKLWRFGISGNEDQDKLLKVFRAYVTVHDPSLVSILEGGPLPGTGELKLKPATFNKAEPEKIGFEFTAAEKSAKGYTVSILDEPVTSDDVDDLLKKLETGALGGSGSVLFQKTGRLNANQAVKGVIDGSGQIEILQDLDKGKYLVFVDKIGSPTVETLAGAVLTIEGEKPPTECDDCETILECLVCFDKAFVEGVFE